MPKWFALVLLVLLLSVLALLVWALYVASLILDYITISAAFSQLSVRIAFSGAFVVVAIILHALKKSRLQVVYGLFQVAFGLVSNWLSLDSWSHLLTGSGPPKILYAQLVIVGVGTYAIGRGLSNVFDGFNRIFPWSAVVTSFKIGYNQPTNVRVPKILLKYQIDGTKAALAAREEDLTAASQAGKDTKLIKSQIDELRKELEVANERYQKEVLKHK
jgi:hypothetical protein